MNKIAEAALRKIANNRLYKDFDSLVKYYNTQPDDGISGEETARRHLEFELAKRVGEKLQNRRHMLSADGRFYLQVPDNGRKSPLEPYMDQYAQAFADLAEHDLGNTRAIVFGDKGHTIYAAGDNGNDKMTEHLKIPKGFSGDIRDLALQQARLILKYRNN